MVDFQQTLILKVVRIFVVGVLSVSPEAAAAAAAAAVSKGNTTEGLAAAAESGSSTTGGAGEADTAAPRVTSPLAGIAHATSATADAVAAGAGSGEDGGDGECGVANAGVADRDGATDAAGRSGEDTSEKRGSSRDTSTAILRDAVGDGHPLSASLQGAAAAPVIDEEGGEVPLPSLSAPSSKSSPVSGSSGEQAVGSQGLEGGGVGEGDGGGLWASLSRDVRDAVLGSVDISALQVRVVVVVVVVALGHLRGERQATHKLCNYSFIFEFSFPFV